MKYKDMKEILSEPVFHNTKIKIGGNVIKDEKFIHNGIYCIAHFLDENGTFLTLEGFKEVTKLKTNFLFFNGCKMAIKKWLKSQVWDCPQITGMTFLWH